MISSKNMFLVRYFELFLNKIIQIENSSWQFFAKRPLKFYVSHFFYNITKHHLNILSAKNSGIFWVTKFMPNMIKINSFWQHLIKFADFMNILVCMYVFDTLSRLQTLIYLADNFFGSCTSSNRFKKRIIFNSKWAGKIDHDKNYMFIFSSPKKNRFENMLRNFLKYIQ